MTPALSYVVGDGCSSLEDSSPQSSSSLLPQHHHNSEACLRQMLSEEDRVYAEEDSNRRRRPSSSSSPSENDDAAPGHLTVWRERVAQWAYTVVDHVGADRAVVYNVLLLLDAYLDAVLSSSSSHNSAATDVENAIDAVDAATYQLLAMSCLYLVLRLRDGGAHRLSVEQLVSMGRNDASSSSAPASTTSTNTTEGGNNKAAAAVVTPARIARTMKSVVRTLASSWRAMVYAPSPGEFVVAYVERMQHSDAANGTPGSASSTSTTSKIDDLLQASKWSSILDDAAYLAELSVCDTYLRYDRPSVVAYAALLNVLRCHGSFAEGEEEGDEKSTLRQDLQSLQRLTGCVGVSRTTVRTIYSRLGYVQSQSLDAAMAAPTSSHADQQQEEEEAATAANIVPQDDDDEVEIEVEEEEVVAMAPTAAAIVISAASSPSPTAPSTTTTTRGGGVKRRISAVVSYDDVSAVVDAALPPAGNAADASTSTESLSDSEEEEKGFPVSSSSSSSSSSSGMKRVRSYSSDLSSFADPDEVSKRMRLVESRQ